MMSKVEDFKYNVNDEVTIKVWKDFLVPYELKIGIIKKAKIFYGGKYYQLADTDMWYAEDSIIACKRKILKTLWDDL